MSGTKTTIYTINEKEYDEAMRILHKLGYKWCDETPCNEGWKPSDGVNRLIYLTINSESKCISFKTEQPERYRYDYIMPLAKFIELHPTPFTKTDLEDGMIVKLRDDRYYMYFKKFNKCVRYEGYISLEDYNDDLCCILDGAYDIVAIYNLKDLTSLVFNTKYLKLVWERPDKVYMTISEIEEKLGIKNLEIVKE